MTTLSITNGDHQRHSSTPLGHTTPLLTIKSDRQIDTETLSAIDSDHKDDTTSLSITSCDRLGSTITLTANNDNNQGHTTTLSPIDSDRQCHAVTLSSINDDRQGDTMALSIIRNERQGDTSALSPIDDNLPDHIATLSIINDDHQDNTTTTSTFHCDTFADTNMKSTQIIEKTAEHISDNATTDHTNEMKNDELSDNAIRNARKMFLETLKLSQLTNIYDRKVESATSSDAHKHTSGTSYPKPFVKTNNLVENDVEISEFLNFIPHNTRQDNIDQQTRAMKNPIISQNYSKTDDEISLDQTALEFPLHCDEALIDEDVRFKPITDKMIQHANEVVTQSEKAGPQKHAVLDIATASIATVYNNKNMNPWLFTSPVSRPTITSGTPESIKRIRLKFQHGFQPLQKDNGADVPATVGVQCLPKHPTPPTLTGANKVLDLSEPILRSPPKARHICGPLERVCIPYHYSPKVKIVPTILKTKQIKPSTSVPKLSQHFTEGTSGTELVRYTRSSEIGHQYANHPNNNVDFTSTASKNVYGSYTTSECNTIGLLNPDVYYKTCPVTIVYSRPDSHTDTTCTLVQTNTIPVHTNTTPVFSDATPVYIDSNIITAEAQQSDNAEHENAIKDKLRVKRDIDKKTKTQTKDCPMVMDDVIQIVEETGVNMNINHNGVHMMQEVPHRVEESVSKFSHKTDVYESHNDNPDQTEVTIKECEKHDLSNEAPLNIGNVYPWENKETNVDRWSTKVHDENMKDDENVNDMDDGSAYIKDEDKSMDYENTNLEDGDINVEDGNTKVDEENINVNDDNMIMDDVNMNEEDVNTNVDFENTNDRSNHVRDIHVMTDIGKDTEGTIKTIDCVNRDKDSKGSPNQITGNKLSRIVTDAQTQELDNSMIFEVKTFTNKQNNNMSREDENISDEVVQPNGCLPKRSEELSLNKIVIDKRCLGTLEYGSNDFYQKCNTHKRADDVEVATRDKPYPLTCNDVATSDVAQIPKERMEKQDQPELSGVIQMFGGRKTTRGSLKLSDLELASVSMSLCDFSSNANAGVLEHALHVIDMNNNEPEGCLHVDELISNNNALPVENKTNESENSKHIDIVPEDDVDPSPVDNDHVVQNQPNVEQANLNNHQMIPDERMGTKDMTTETETSKINDIVAGDNDNTVEESLDLCDNTCSSVSDISQANKGNNYCEASVTNHIADQSFNGGYTVPMSHHYGGTIVWYPTHDSSDGQLEENTSHLSPKSLGNQLISFLERISSRAGRKCDAESTIAMESTVDDPPPKKNLLIDPFEEVPKVTDSFDVQPKVLKSVNGTQMISDQKGHFDLGFSAQNKTVVPNNTMAPCNTIAPCNKVIQNNIVAPIDMVESYSTAPPNNTLALNETVSPNNIVAINNTMTQYKRVLPTYTTAPNNTKTTNNTVALNNTVEPNNIMSLNNELPLNNTEYQDKPLDLTMGQKREHETDKVVDDDDTPNTKRRKDIEIYAESNKFDTVDSDTDRSIGYCMSPETNPIWDEHNDETGECYRESLDFQSMHARESHHIYPKREIFAGDQSLLKNYSQSVFPEKIPQFISDSRQASEKIKLRKRGNTTTTVPKARATEGFDDEDEFNELVIDIKEEGADDTIGVSHSSNQSTRRKSKQVMTGRALDQSARSKHGHVMTERALNQSVSGKSASSSETGDDTEWKPWQSHKTYQYNTSSQKLRKRKKIKKERIDGEAISAVDLTEVERPLKCNICKKSSKSKTRLCEHLISKGLGEQKCDKCSAFFHTMIDLVHHKMEKHVKCWFICSLCDGKFTSQFQLDQHDAICASKRQNTERFKCTICVNSFQQEQHLISHTRYHNSKDLFPCTAKGCVYGGTSEAVLHQHVQKHHQKSSQVWECPISACMAQFSSIIDLNTHVTEHTGSTVMTCNFCGSVMGTKPTLAKHLQRHSEVKPMGCNLCEFRCRQRNSINYHMAKHHPIEWQQKLVCLCPVCDKRFEGKFHLQCHQRKTGHVIKSESAGGKTKQTKAIKKNYKCNVCDRTFKGSFNLTCHQWRAKHDGTKKNAGIEQPGPNSMDKIEVCSTDVSNQLKSDLDENDNKLCNTNSGYAYFKNYAKNDHSNDEKSDHMNSKKADNENNEKPDHKNNEKADLKNSEECYQNDAEKSDYNNNEKSDYKNDEKSDAKNNETPHHSSVENIKNTDNENPDHKQNETSHHTSSAKSVHYRSPQYEVVDQNANILHGSMVGIDKFTKIRLKMKLKKGPRKSLGSREYPTTQLNAQLDAQLGDSNLSDDKHENGQHSPGNIQHCLKNVQFDVAKHVQRVPEKCSQDPESVQHDYQNDQDCPGTEQLSTGDFQEIFEAFANTPNDVQVNTANIQLNTSNAQVNTDDQVKQSTNT
ncbi:unnamed protein product [Owenia fusiformis]|uniref:Uncharacterized protein n=1 Tax=Owenia fusiformis TaxID=6347 RepID=A0A8J1TLU0_OWEFU|nr:unnamed protein product [Owenia fusiformis]